MKTDEWQKGLFQFVMQNCWDFSWDIHYPQKQSLNKPKNYLNYVWDSDFNVISNFPLKIAEHISLPHKALTKVKFDCFVKPPAKIDIFMRSYVDHLLEGFLRGILILSSLWQRVKRY